MDERLAQSFVDVVISEGDTESELDLIEEEMNSHLSPTPVKFLSSQGSKNNSSKSTINKNLKIRM